MNMGILILSIFIMTFSGSLGAFFLKKGMSKMQKISIFGMLKIPELYTGGILYVLGACMNIILLRSMPYTVVYPMTSLTYVWTMFVSSVLLNEKITKNKVIAVVCIICGICLITV